MAFMDQPADSPPSFKSRHLQLSVEGQSALVTFLPSIKLTSGSAQRARQAIARVRSALHHIGPYEFEILDGGIAARFPIIDPLRLEKAATVIDERLDVLQREKLTGKMVEEILGITSQERRRWTKEGRLPTSGRTFIKRGKNRVSLPLYSPEDIVPLAQSADLLGDWRSAAALSQAKISE